MACGRLLATMPALRSAELLPTCREEFFYNLKSTENTSPGICELASQGNKLELAKTVKSAETPIGTY
jgi:hypothetical protein